MFKNKAEEFLKAYTEYKKTRGTVATQNDIFFELLHGYINSTRKADKKKYAKMILKTKPTMSSTSLWDYVDEEELLVISKT
ncbi:hypothetical protein PPOLYM_02538 [Paenibacillus polymyxa]|uniref:hypothetical protein n=1 Tax=Paenibacillus polymyxa TaxID=1406 RepID=UPI0009476738|nr:hypothetical protein [Paenibacillus polymyxa]APQ59833.1 hypothetical protein VK72_14515 [Paenibacillus polymyxa]VUG06145.1 hypothetical protein PPOLYM_02538 [Paenibacillus polymyxa]